jgi:23S rRNA (adenine2503-C2)-methyltransferase
MCENNNAAGKVRKPVLAGLPLEALTETLKPLPVFRVKQVFKWLSRGVRSFDAMTDLSLPLRGALEKRFSLYASAVSREYSGDDGTIKIQLTLSDSVPIEAVLLTDDEGNRTACLSTQAGCPAGCVFCKTGSLGFERNLSAGEIIEQFLFLRSLSEHSPHERLPNGVSHIVIMGMGEPLLNLAAVRAALAFISADNFSKRRITLSTSGIVDGIRDLADAGPAIRLALSLTTADAVLREKLMPIAKSNPLPSLKEALRSYQRKQKQRITLETVLLGGVNTRQKDVEALYAFARGLDVVVNVIPWNPVAGLDFDGVSLREPSPAETEGFLHRLREKGLNVTRRFRKGGNIAGACGQLGVINAPMFPE